MLFAKRITLRNTNRGIYHSFLRFMASLNINELSYSKIYFYQVKLQPKKGKIYKKK